MTLGADIIPEKINSLEDFLAMFDHDECLGKILSFNYTQITYVGDKEPGGKYWLFINPEREAGIIMKTGDGAQHKFETIQEAIQCLSNIENILKNSKYKLTRNYNSYDPNRPLVVYYWLPENWL